MINYDNKDHAGKINKKNKYDLNVLYHTNTNTFFNMFKEMSNKPKKKKKSLNLFSFIRKKKIESNSI